MVTSLKYDLLVQKLMAESEAKRMNKTTQLTQAECDAEVAAMQDGAISTFATEETHPALTGTSDAETSVNIGQPQTITAEPSLSTQPKRRGRPKGSRNRPKEPK